jgi:REP element-mobilizing transposase RayT
MALRDRYWLLTWTTYGTWLPGDRRGFVSPVRDNDGRQVIHNVVGTPVDKDDPRLRSAATERMAGPSIWLRDVHATVALRQLHAHVAFRDHDLEAAAIMANHVHIVVGVSGDPSPSRLLGDFKSYLSRALNAECGRPTGGTWWTESGSKRKLPDDEAVRMAVDYVRRQAHPLVVWLAPHWCAE